MINILLCNQKGGVGKSMLADEIAFSFERTKNSIAFFDMDMQGGTIHETDQNESADVFIVDTPGALQKDLRTWMQNSDIIIIPTKATSRDIPPLLRMRDLCREVAPDKSVIYVINGFNRFTSAADFIKEAGQAGIRPIFTVPQSEIFVKAAAQEKSVVEYAKNSAAALSILALINYIRGLAGFSEEIVN